MYITVPSKCASVEFVCHALFRVFHLVLCYIFSQIEMIGGGSSLAEAVIAPECGCHDSNSGSRTAEASPSAGLLNSMYFLPTTQKTFLFSQELKFSIFVLILVSFYYYTKLF